MFQVLNSRLGARLALSSLLCPTFAFRSLLRPPISRSKPFAFGTESGYSSTKSELVITQRTMTAGADVGASPSWEDMWSGGLKKGDKWDRGVVSPALTHLLDSGVLPKGRRAFVPGCGRGYEAIAFGKSGFDAIGLDLAPTGIEEAKKVLEQEEEAPSGKVEFIAGDFFKFKASEHGKFDVILDYTFLCALDPTVREAWADHTVSLLKPDGELVTLIFPIVEKAMLKPMRSQTDPRKYDPIADKTGQDG